jgi:alpha-ketoglutarate-dependent taurine dioxygenase
MEDTSQRKHVSARKKLPAVRRAPLIMSQETLVSVEQLCGAQTMPLVVSPALDGVDLIAWAETNRQFIDASLQKYGALLFRGFGMRKVDEFERFIAATSGEWAEYREAATPRRQLSEHIHTSTEYPADQTIFLHNENSHCDSWPMKLYFMCVTPPATGGETPIADCRKVYARLTAETKCRFIEKKVLYVRNFGDGLGFPWQTVFKTNEKSSVDEYCRRAGIKTDWKDNERLRISYVREAVATHPLTRAPLWFNHATFFHVSTLDAQVREALLMKMAESDLPYNTYYGDNSPIEPSVLDELRAAYEQETGVFVWQAGDVLMLDNMLVAHGRRPFSGPRQILVGMAEPYDGK